MEKLFHNLPDRRLSRGQILIYEGDPIDNIYFLASGYVKVSNVLVDGTNRTIFVYAPGDAFPLTSYLSGAGIARYFYECMTDAEIKVMPQKDFESLIKGNIELGEQLITYTYHLNQQFTERIEALTAKSARQKVVALLSYLAGRAGSDHNGKIRLNIPMTSQNIADMCNLTRETASLQMVKLRKDGIIHGSRNLVVDNQRLQKTLVS